MRIEQVAIRGFQSHVDSVFRLSPGLTVITGPSDAGKTAVIRALRWLAFNEPTGDAFLHTVTNGEGAVIRQAEEASVNVTLEDGTKITKTRRGKKTSYQLSGHPEPWEKAEVPQEVREALGLDKQSYGDTFETCLNFAFQLDPPFLLSEAGSVGAKVLGRLAGSEVVDRAIGAVTKMIRRTRDEKAQLEKTVGQLDVELLAYTEVDEDAERVASLEARFAEVQERVRRAASLEQLRDGHRQLMERIQALTDRLQQFKDLPVLQTLAEHILDKRDRIAQLEGQRTALWQYMKQLQDARTRQKELEAVPVLVQQLGRVAGQTARFNRLQEVNEHFDRLLAELERLSAQADRYQGLEDRGDALAMLHSKWHRLTQLTDVLEQYSGRQDHYLNVRDLHAEWVREMTAADLELANAWDAAGGICPLCGFPLGVCDDA